METETNGKNEQKTKEKEKEEFDHHLSMVILHSAEELSLVVERLDELLTWLPEETKG